jgi:hypothetical protein
MSEQRYVCCITAMKHNTHEGALLLDLYRSMFFVNANSEHEAIGMASVAMQRVYPASGGWFRQSCLVNHENKLPTITNPEEAFLEEARHDT